MNASLFRYIVPIVPVLLILTSKMLSDYTSSNLKASRIVSMLLLGIVLSYSLIYTIAADLEFTNDSRYQLHDWISRNVKERSKIEISIHCPNILNDDEYIVIKRPQDLDLDDAASSALSNSTYFRVTSYNFETQISSWQSGNTVYRLARRIYESTSKGVVEV